MDLPFESDVQTVLASVDTFSPHALVCFPRKRRLHASDAVVVADSRELSDDEDVPADAGELGLDRPLDRSALVGVVNNYRAQRGDGGSTAELVEALSYFLANDAYMALH